MHDVDAHFAHRRNAEQSIHIGTIEIDEAPALVHQVGDGTNILFEDAQGVRVGHHDCSDVLGHRRRHRVQTHVPLWPRLQRHNTVAVEGAARGIGAVRRIGDEHFLTWVAAIEERRTDHHQAAQFPMRSCRWLQADPSKARDMLQQVAELRHDPQHTSVQRRRIERMHTGKAAHASDLLAHPRVVLHGARTERIHHRVDTGV